MTSKLDANCEAVLTSSVLRCVFVAQKPGSQRRMVIESRMIALLDPLEERSLVYQDAPSNSAEGFPYAVVLGMKD